MNHEKQPEALRLADQLATTYTVRDRWNASHYLRYLYERVQELEAELVKEAARTAEEKLRADQMSQQHSTQAALNSEARKELAEIKLSATQPAAQGLNTSDLLAEIEREYVELADIHNNWHGRNTPNGQAKLCRLRDLISKHTGREPREVQDDYGMRAAQTDKQGEA